MTQHPIDLLPESARARSQAQLRAARRLTFAVLSLLTLAALITHSRISVEQSRDQLQAAEDRAAAVLALESKAAALRSLLADCDAQLERYEMVALPIPIAAILATIINELPPSVTVDSINIDAGYRRFRRSVRSRETSDPDQPASRTLTAEIGGFAVSDKDVAELIDRLSAVPPLRNVNLDFSRSRAVRERIAREFRLSFRIDLDHRYEIVDRSKGRSANTLEMSRAGS